MNSILKKSPKMQDNSTRNKIIIILLSVLSAAFLLAPVLVGFMSDFTKGDDTVLYCLAKGFFALSLIVTSVLCYVNNKISYLLISAVSGLITSLFPLFNSIGDFTNIKSIADKFSISQDYSGYLLYIGIYLLYTILCILSGLYICGYFKWPVVILLVSTVTSIATLFIAIDKGTTYESGMFEVLTFASTALTCIIPVFAVLTTQKNIIKPKHAKRSE